MGDMAGDCIEQEEIQTGKICPYCFKQTEYVEKEQ
jgi:hypothetical protein